MPRLRIASGLFQNLMVVDHDAFFQDPYREAQRALMLADTLIAAHQITSPQAPSEADMGDDVARVDIEVGVRAAKAEFAMRYLVAPSSHAVRPRIH